MTRGGNDAEPTAIEDEGGPTVDYDGGLQAVAEANRVAVFHGGASGAPPPARGAGAGAAPDETLPSRSPGEGSPLPDAAVDSPFLGLVTGMGAATGGTAAAPPGGAAATPERANGHPPAWATAAPRQTDGPTEPPAAGNGPGAPVAPQPAPAAQTAPAAPATPGAEPANPPAATPPTPTPPRPRSSNGRAPGVAPKRPLWTATASPGTRTATTRSSWRSPRSPAT